MKKSYQVLKWTAEVREKELQCLEEVELLDNHDPAVEFESDSESEAYDFYVPGHVPTINGEVKLYKTFARAKQGAQAIYNKCGYVQKFEIHTIEIRANDKKEIVTVRGLP